MKHPAYGLSFLNRLEKPGGAPPADQRSRRDLANYSAVMVQTASDTNGHKMQSSLRSFREKMSTEPHYISNSGASGLCVGLRFEIGAASQALIS